MKILKLGMVIIFFLAIIVIIVLKFVTPNIQNGYLTYDSGITTLNLSSKGIESLPSQIGKFTNLVSFDVSHNNLTGALPSEIGNMTKLENLNASYNRMTGIPAEIGKLTNLKTLNLSNNQITGIPNEIYKLKTLESLDLRNNNVSESDILILKQQLPNTEILY